MQLYEIVNLVNELLPPMPDTQGVHAASSSNGALSSRGSGRKHPGITIASKVEDGQGVVAEESPREILLRHQPELLVQFGSDLFPVLVQVRFSVADWLFSVENLSLLAIFRIFGI